MQEIIRDFTGYLITSFIPLYVYKVTQLKEIKWHSRFGFLFVIIPAIYFYLYFYPHFGDFELTRKVVYIIPAVYASFGFVAYVKGIRREYSQTKDQVLYRDRVLFGTALIFWCCGPLAGPILGGDRCIQGLESCPPIIAFNLYFVIRSLKLYIKTKPAPPPAETESKICLSNYDLTEREIAVAELAYHGKTYKDIGKELFISEARVKQIIGSVFRKLGVESKVELVKKLKWQETIQER